MTVPAKKKASLKSLKAPSSPPKVHGEGTDKPPYQLDQQLPNHKNPSYMPPGIQPSVGFDPNIVPRLRKKKKES